MKKMKKTSIGRDDYPALHREVVELLQAARSATARSINAIMTATYWSIGRRIIQSEQGGETRAEYGEQLIERLGRDLTNQFGRGFGARNLAQMRSFYLTWPEHKILQTASAKSRTVLPLNEKGDPSSIQALAQHFRLPWSAYVRLLSVKTPEARTFYEIEALRCGWSVRQLDKIGRAHV